MYSGDPIVISLQQFFEGLLLFGSTEKSRRSGGAPGTFTYCSVDGVLVTRNFSFAKGRTALNFDPVDFFDSEILVIENELD